MSRFPSQMSRVKRLGAGLGATAAVVVLASACHTTSSQTEPSHTGTQPAVTARATTGTKSAVVPPQAVVTIPPQAVVTVPAQPAVTAPPVPAATVPPQAVVTAPARPVSAPAHTVVTAPPRPVVTVPPAPVVTDPAPVVTDPPNDGLQCAGPGTPCDATLSPTFFGVGQPTGVAAK